MKPGPLRRGLAVSLPAFCLALALALTAWIYWPGIQGPALLDDRSSLSMLERLVENPALAGDYVFGDKSGTLGRSVTMATFVLEKLYLGGGTAHSKTVNTVLHLLNGALVVWLFCLLLRHARVPGYVWVSILAGLAWMVSPLYVSTVLYTVQRMAMLAAFFTLAALISYLHGRFGVMRGRSGAPGFALAGIFGLLAIFSKENAVVLIPILLSLEALWLRFKGASGAPVSWLRQLTFALMVLGAMAVLLLVILRYDWLMATYQHRQFTPPERALTQSRILWDYLAQHYWPDTGRMGLYHDDVIVSKSLTQPMSTLWSVIAWLVTMLCGLVGLFYRRGRYFVFAIGFFLLGHGVESTILSLELYFEHRNYLPGVGLFLALALLYAVLVEKWRELQGPLLAWLGVFVLYLSLQTSSQVQVWSSTPLLRINHVTGHPESFRANLDMANQLARVGERDAALAYSAKAHAVSPSESEGDYGIRDVALSCMAGKPLPPERLEAIGARTPARPLGSVTTFHVLVSLLQDDVCPGMDWLAFADRMRELYLVDARTSRASANMYSMLASMENALQRYGNAYAYTELFLALSPDNTRGLLMKLHFATALGRTAVADQLIESLQALDEDGKLSVGDRQTLALYLED